MESPTGYTGVDMNNHFNLELYSQILVFMTDASREYIDFENPQHSEQRTLQSLAHKLDLDYEYSKASGIARISRPDVPISSDQPTLDLLAWPQNTESPGILNNIFDYTTTDPFNSDEFHSIPNNITDPLYNMDTSIFPSASLSVPISSLDRSLQRNDFQHKGQSDIPSVSHVNVFPSNLDQPTSNTNWVTPVPCKFFLRGSCYAGTGCIFSHEITNTTARYVATAQLGKEKSDDSFSNFRDHFEGDSNTSTSDEFPNLLTNSEALTRDAAETHSHTHSMDIGSSNALTYEDETLDQQQNTYTVSTSRNVLLNQIDMPGVQPEIPCCTLENGEKIIPSEPGRLEDMNWIQTGDDIGGLNSADNMRRKHGLHSVNIAQSIASTSSRAQSPSGSGYQDTGFDSNSVNSGSRASVASGPGRRGPLSRLSKLGMNAVRRVGACWRCRFLRKFCDPKNPCGLCPKGDRSKWEMVGCRRGKFKMETPLTRLCQPLTMLLRSDLRHYSKEQENTIATFQQALQTREAWIRLSENEFQDLENQTLPFHSPSSPAIPEVLERDVAGQSFLSSFSTIYNSMKQQPDLATLRPLKQCVLAIVWEVFECTYSRHVLGNDGDLEGLIRLLPSAALFQANFDGDELIAQSLICLRSSLEALRTKTTSFQSENLHFDCGGPSQCKVEWMANLTMNQTLYFRELSRVLFKKENSHNKKKWWLSTFYSFRIQGLVRKVLIELTRDSEDSMLQSKQYLHIPLRLFIASSGTYDPLIADPDLLLQSTDKSLPTEDDCEKAKRAVGQIDWRLKGIFNSGNYLKMIFEDIAYLETNSPRYAAQSQFETSSPRYAAQSRFETSSPRYQRSQYSYSDGSSFSDLDDASITQSALEEALASNMQAGGGIAQRMSSISQALRSKYL